MTVSLTKAKLRGARHITLTDLPGIYAPAAGSEDEALTHRTLQTDPPDLLLFVADGTQLSRALELLTALRAGRRAVLAVNMCDELEKAGTVLDEADFPAAPAHEGYEFTGWDYNGAPVSIGDTTEHRFQSR